MGAGEASAALAFASAFLVALLLVPVAIRAAFATDFLDRPRDYKKHGSATPYLGGSAVVLAFLVGAAAFGSGASGFATVLVLALGLTVLGSWDDRRDLGPGIRLLTQLGAGLVLWVDGIRWELVGSPWLDLPITLIWVAGLANAFNLLDNIDGATATTACVSAAGIGAIALGSGADQLAAVSLALSGACAAFLCFNLARPARIFLGDGGSVPIGFLIAALALLLPQDFRGEALLAAVPLAGIAIFDTTLVVLSRTRRGVSILTGGRDHTTHRLLLRLHSPQRVAVALACAQLALDGLAGLMRVLSEQMVVVVALGYVAAAAMLLAAFEHPSVAPRPAEQST